MARQTVNTGSALGDRTGDNGRSAFTKVNQNFAELYVKHDITAAETSAGVTPTNYGYEPGDVRRYGATGDGTTDDRAAFVAALSVADAFVPFGTYRINGRLSLTEYGIIGEGWATTGSARQVKLVFYNQTTTTLGSVYTDYDNWKGRAIPIKNVALYASSWDGTTGALGYGIDITARVDIENVLVTGFGSHGIFLHNTDTDGEAPYNSSLKGVSCFTNGGHGMVIGTGANDLYIRDYQGKWNGAPSYGVAPSVAGNYDGLFLSRDGDGNPGSAFYSYTPEGVFVIGGDCSYNSRYGWNLSQCQGGVFHMGYAEGNLTASPANMNLGNGLTHCFVATAQVGGGAAGVNFGSVATAAGDAHTNRFFIGGRDCGVGNSNTETSRYSYAMAKHWNWVAYSADQSAGAVIKPFGTDVGQLVRVGSTGGWIIEPPHYTVATLPAIGSFSAGAMIFVTDETGGSILAFSDGTNWRRVTDRAIVA